MRLCRFVSDGIWAVVTRRLNVFKVFLSLCVSSSLSSSLSSLSLFPPLTLDSFPLNSLLFLPLMFFTLARDNTYPLLTIAERTGGVRRMIKDHAARIICPVCC